MIILEPNTVNLVVLSLSEKVTINNPTFLFRFVSKESKIEYVCISSPVEDYSFNRQSFNIETVASGAVALSGQVALITGDEYDYYVYAQSSTTNTDYTIANEQVQQGLARFNKTITQRSEYERGSTTRKVYTR
jgi:hypothetical protein